MKILIIAYPNLNKDPRPYRQIKALYKNHDVYSIGGGPSGLEKKFYYLNKHKFYFEIFRLFLLKLGLYKKYYWDIHKKRILKETSSFSFDLIIAHEIRLVPLAYKIGKEKTPIILDAHEYSPKNFDDNLLWRFFIKKYYTKLCSIYIPKLKKLITVSQGIVEEYRKEFGSDAILITNACEYVDDLQPKQVNFNKIKIIHHGIASSSRRLELLIEMMEHLDVNYELNLMLVSSTYREFYIKKLRKLAKGKNINFLKPVSKAQLVTFSNDFDIGIHFVPPTNFNLKYGLGNKFFEYIQSRLAIAIGPDIEMSRYVNKYDLGMISKELTSESLASTIKNTNAKKLMYYKNQSHKFAKELSSLKNDKEFLKLIK